MPVLDITILECRPCKKKRSLIKKVTEATIRTWDARLETVCVTVREAHPSYFAVAGKPKGLPPD